MNEGPFLRKVKLSPDEVFGFWGNDIVRMQYDPVGGEDQTVRLFDRHGEYCGGTSPAERPEIAAIIANRRSGTHPEEEENGE